MLIAAFCLNSNFQNFVFLIKFIPFLFKYIINKISTKTLKEKFLENFKICDSFNLFYDRSDKLITEALKKSLKKKALNSLRFHKFSGDRVIICSASPRLLLKSIAKYLEVELVCTELRVSTDGFWQPIISGLNCKREEKLHRISNYLGSLENYFVEVYGDSKGDKELLEIADIPHYKDFSRKERPYGFFK